MKHLQRRTVTTAAQLAAWALCAAATCSAHAQSKAEPSYFNGPSIARAHQQATFSGGNFKANSAVTVMIKSPAGNEAAYSAVVGADGKLVYAFIPTENGAYTLRVTNPEGKVLAAANVNAQR